MAGRLYFFAGVGENAQGYAYDFEGNRQSDDDVNVSALIPDFTGDISAAGVSETRIALVSGNLRKAFIFDRDWNRQASEDITLTNDPGHNGICATDDRWVVINSGFNELQFYDFEGVQQTTETQTLSSRAWTGLFSDGTYIYLINNTNNRVHRRTYGSTTLSTFIQNLGTGQWQGGGSTSTRFVFVNNTGSRAVFYDHSGTLQSTESFNIVSGSYFAMVAVEASDASLTITADSSDLREGVPFTATFAFSADVTDFAITDITVTGASKGTFTAVDADTYTLVLTPNAGAGTVEVSVAEDAVSPGNTAASASWTRSARATATVTFNKTELIGGHSAEATIEFSESVTGFAVSDLSVNAGSLSNFSGSGTTYTVDITAPNTGSGTITLTLAANAVDEGLLQTTGAIAYSPFEVTWSRIPSGTVNNTFSVQLNFSHPITGLTGIDLALRRESGNDSNNAFRRLTNDATLTQITDTNNYTVDLDLSGTFDGVYQLRLRSRSVSADGTNYPSSSFDSTTFTIDSDFGQPTATITFDPSSVRVGRTTQATIEFSESVTGFGVGDLSVDVGSLSNFSGSGDTYTVDVTAPATGSGNITLTLAADAVDAGNAETTGTVAYSALPTATVTFDPTLVRGGRTTQATIEWSENVSDFAIGDLSVDVGSLSNFSGTGDTYTVDVTAPATGSGTITLTIAADAVSVGNAETTGSVAYQALPIATLTFNREKLVNGRIAAATLVWSESVTGFAVGDLSVDVGSLSNFSGSGDTYTVDVTAPASGSGDITLTVAADAVDAGNAETAASIEYAPFSATWSVVPSGTVDNTFSAQLNFSHPVTGFVPGDLTLRRNSGNDSNNPFYRLTNDTTITQITDTNNYTIDVALTGEYDGEYVLRFRQRTIEVASDSYPASNIDSSAFNIDSDFGQPTATIRFSDTAIKGGRSTQATIEWSASVTGFVVGDLSVNVGSLSNFSGTGDSYTVDVTAPRTGSGTLTLTLAADAVSAGNDAVTGNVSYSALPTATITFDPTSLRGGRTAEATLTFSESVTGLADSDLSVNVGTLSNFAGSGDTYTVDVTAPSTGSGNIVLTIAKDAVDQELDETTGSVAYQPLPTASIAFDTTLVRGGRTAEATVTFSESVTGLAIGDFSTNVGSVGALMGSGDTYTVVVTAPVSGMGTITLTLAADAVDQKLDETTGSVAYQPLPTASIAFSETLVGGGRTVSATVTFSESVMGITVADLSVNVGSLSNFSGSGDMYSVDVTAPNTGSGTITLAVRRDAAIEGNAGVSAGIAYRALASVTITFPVATVVPGDSVIATLEWSEAVTGFDATDVVVSGIGASEGTFSGSGRTYQLVIQTSVVGRGTIRLRVRRDAVAEGNNQTDATIALERPDALTVSIRCGYPVRYVQAIGANDPVDLNDYLVRLEWNRGVVGFNEVGVSVTGATVVGFRVLSESDYAVAVRPPDSGAGTITVTVAADAAAEGNDQTQATFRWTDEMDVETLFDWDTAIPNILQGDQSGQFYGPVVGLVIEASRVRMLARVGGVTQIHALRLDGTRLTGEDESVSASGLISNRYLDVNLSLVNDRWFANTALQDTSGLRRDFYYSYWSYRGSGAWTLFNASDFGIDVAEFGLAGQVSARNAAHSAAINRWGLFFPSRFQGRVFAQDFAGMQRDISGITVSAFGGIPLVAVADRVYSGGVVYRVVSDSGAGVASAEKVDVSGTGSTDFAHYGGWLYHTGTRTDTQLYRINLAKYRPPVARARIVPQFVTEGESLDLKHFATGAETILFEDGYDAPRYLSIDAHLNLAVEDGVIAEDVCVLVKCRAYTLRGDAGFAFYLVVKKKATPVWKDVRTLPVDNGETVNLFDLVAGADRIEWRAGFTVPTGYTLTDGQLTVANQTREVPVAVALTAFNTEGGRDKTFDVLPRVAGAIASSDVYAYRVLIAGIDVTDDLLEVPSIHHSLDVVNPNEFVSDDASFRLSSDAGKYDGRVDGNFWNANGLNTNGYLSEIALWVDIFDDPENVQSKLLFQGLVIEVQSSINDVSVVVNCVDRTYQIKNTAVGTVGLEKYAALQRVRETYEGVYTPDTGLLPIVRDSAVVVSGAAEVPVETYQNAPESVLGGLSCYVSGDTVLTRGGYVSEDPLLKFRTPYRRRRLDFLIRQLSEASGFFNAKVEIQDAAPTAEAHISSRGNVAFNVERTKTVRTVVDWLHDSGADRFWLLLSHPSGYVRDLLVAYDPTDDSYETIYEFSGDLQVSQLATGNFDTFYVLATTANGLDGTEVPVNPDDAVFDHWDSSRETEDTRILRYIVSTGRLYYRYANWTEFGVARATAGGTTTAVLTADRDDYFNTLNFDFDVADNGDVFMVSGEGDPGASSLNVQKYEDATGSDTVVAEFAVGFGGLTTVDAGGGAYLGCHETLYANGRLYCVVPVQRVTGSPKVRDIKRSAGAVLCCIDPEAQELTVLARYDYVQLSCRSLTLHENSVYFAEYPNASTHFPPCNPDLEGWDASRRCNDVPPNKMWLKRVSAANRVASVVSPWYEGRAFNATAVKMLSTGDGLHAIVRHSDRYEISGADAGASDPENEQWVALGRRIPYYVEAVPRGSLHAAMVALAKVGNARLQIVGNRFRFVDLDPTEALCSGAVSAASTRLNYEAANKAFPASGYVLVGKEIMRYGRRGPRQLMDVERGVAGTEAVSHSVGDRVLFLENVISLSPMDCDPLSDINIQIDTNKFYNSVGDAEVGAAAVDTESVGRFGSRSYRNDLMLSEHQIAWRRYINAKTLNRLKDIKSVVRLRLMPSFHLDIGDVVAFAYGGELLMPIQIIDIQHTQGSGTNPRAETHIIGQEVKPLPRMSFGDATVLDKTFNQYERITPFVLPSAVDPKDSYVYSLEGLSPGLRFDPRTREVSGAPLFPQSMGELRYIVTDRGNPTLTAFLTFRITVTETTLAFDAQQSDLLLPLNESVSETLVGASGGTGTLHYGLTGILATGLSFDAATRALSGTPTARHGLRDYTYRVTDAIGVSRAQTFKMQTGYVGRFMIQFQDNNKLLSWDFQGRRKASEDIAINALIGRNVRVRGMAATPTRVGVLVDDNTETKVYVLDRGFQRIPGEDFDLPDGNWYGLGWLADTEQWLVGHPNVRDIVRFTRSGSQVPDASFEIPIGFGSPWSFAVTTDRVYSVYNVTSGGGGILSYMHDGTRMTSEDKSFTSGSWAGATSIQNRMCAFTSDTDSVRMFDLPSLNSVSGGFSIPSGLYVLGSFFALNPDSYEGN